MAKLSGARVLDRPINRTALSGELHLSDVDQLMSEHDIKILVCSPPQEDVIAECKTLYTQQVSRTISRNILVDLETPRQLLGKFLPAIVGHSSSGSHARQYLGAEQSNPTTPRIPDTGP